LRVRIEDFTLAMLWAKKRTNEIVLNRISGPSDMRQDRLCGRQIASRRGLVISSIRLNPTRTFLFRVAATILEQSMPSIVPDIR
jgi:hypothetical protein